MMKADFVAASQTTAEMMVTMGIRKYIGVLIYPGSILDVDNQATVVQIKVEYTSDRTKNIDLQYKFAEYQELNKMIKVLYCDSKSMHVNNLSSTVPAPRLSHLRGLFDQSKCTY